MNTLTGIEADRVNQIIKHAIDRLQILSYIPTSWDDDIFSEISCQPVLNSLEKQWLSEEQLKQFYNGGSTGEGGKEIEATKQCHRATRSTCRNLVADRPSLQVLMSRPELQSEDFPRFIKYLVELKNQVHTRLTTTVEDEAANRSILHDLTERERRMEESRDALQAKLNEVREEKEHMSFNLDQTLRKLQLELQDITQHNSMELESVQREMTDAIGKATADHELRMRQLQDQLDSMERQTNECMDRNRDEEQKMRKEKSRSEIALASKISQYDEDMKERDSQLNEIKSSLSIEEKEYQILKVYFEKIDADLNRDKEEERIIRAVVRREEFGKRVLYLAARKIQCIARGRQGRAIVAKLKSKKGGKKGKKK
jgi:chromosome segregation ATPase